MQGKQRMFSLTMLQESSYSIISYLSLLLNWLKEHWEIFAAFCGFIWVAIRYTKRKVPELMAFANIAKMFAVFQKVVVGRLDEIAEQHHYILARQNLATDISPIPTFRADAKGHLIYINDAYSKLFNKEDEELLGDGWFGVVDDKDLDKVMRLWLNSTNSQAQTSIEFSANTFQGIKRCKSFVSVIKNSKGEFVEFYGKTILLGE